MLRFIESLPPGASSSPGRPRGSVGQVKGTLVLIHGFPLSARMWEPQLELAQHGWRIIAPQLSGFDGGTTETARTSVDDYAGDVIDLLDALHIHDAVIGGLSMGGYVTFAMFRYAARYFRGMILADTRAEADTPEGIDGRKAMLDLLGREGPSAVAEAIMPKLLCDATREHRPGVEDAIRGFVCSNSPEVIAGAITALMTRQDATPILSSIHCPTLVLVGDQDALTPPALSESIHHRIPGSELVTLAGAGHMSNMEQPDAFNLALAHFLEHRV